MKLPPADPRIMGTEYSHAANVGSLDVGTALEAVLAVVFSTPYRQGDAIRVAGALGRLGFSIEPVVTAPRMPGDPHPDEPHAFHIICELCQEPGFITVTIADRVGK